ncbi:MAG TPA: hypothetical protein VMR97_11325 [Acidimicrobiales bacterium]|nr:hypothetical protein [Acidimicrobiales bacterium]
MGAAFYAVFAIFVVLIVGLGVISVRWAIGRDRAARALRGAQNGGRQPDQAVRASGRSSPGEKGRDGST